MKIPITKLIFGEDAVSENLQKLRERLLNTLLVSAAIFGTLLYGLALFPAIENELTPAVVIYTVIYIWMMVVAFARRLPYKVRAGSMLFFFFTLGVVNLVLNGLNVDAGLFLLSFISMTTLLAGPRGGTFAIALTIVTVLITGFLFISRAIHPALALPQQDPILWIIGGIILLFMGTLLGISLTTLVYGLETNLVKANTLSVDLQQAVEETRKSEERFRTLIEGSTDLIGILNVDGTVQYLSPSVTAMLGYGTEEILGVSILDYIHPDDLTGVIKALTPGVPPEEIGPHLELRIRHKDGSWRIVDVRGRELHASPVIDGYIINGRDITERRLSAAHIQRQFEQLTALRAIDTAINASLDLGLTLKIAIAQVTAQRGIDAASVLLLNPLTHNLEYKAGRGFRASAIERTSLRLGAGYAGRAALERHTIHFENVEESNHPYTRPDLFIEEGFITYSGVPLIAKGEVRGVLEVFRRTPFDYSPNSNWTSESEWIDFLETLAEQVAIAIDNAQLFTNLQRSNFDLVMAYDATIEGWSKALDLRDKETEGHTQRVIEMTMKLARSMGVSETDMTHLRRGALLHDIGKIGIPDHILFKPGSFTDEEWAVMHMHPMYAYEMLAPINYLHQALDIPYCHHEKWDGSGYPRGLKGEQIPLAARIFTVADVWDALTSDRPYRRAWTESEAINYIREQAGKHFDPNVVNAFLERR